MEIPFPVEGDRVRSPETHMGYVIGEVIGQGQFGVTFACRDLFGNDLVAKVLKPKGKWKLQVEAEWGREADLLTDLRHPGVIHIYDAFEYSELYHIIMERAQGTVRSLVERHGPLPRVEFFDFSRQLLSALHFIHLNNVIHRDVHADNVLYSFGHDGRRRTINPKITDFGISKQLFDADRGVAFTSIGREYEAAPELALRGYSTPQSDLYQAGLVLYYVLTGRSAISPEDGNADRAIGAELPRRRAEGLDNCVGDCLASMLHFNEAERPVSALEAWRDLSDCQ